MNRRICRSLLRRGVPGASTTLGKSQSPLNVIVTARGAVNLALPVFQSGEVPVLIVTTTHGEKRLRQQRLQPGVEVSAVQSAAGTLNARAILETVSRVRQSDVVSSRGWATVDGGHLCNAEPWMNSS